MVIVPDEIPAKAPAVLPDSVTATMFWVCTDWVASITTRWFADDLTVIMFEPVN
jgi:hypothetical protein